MTVCVGVWFGEVLVAIAEELRELALEKTELVKTDDEDTIELEITIVCIEEDEIDIVVIDKLLEVDIVEEVNVDVEAVETRTVLELTRVAEVVVDCLRIVESEVNVAS